MAMYRCGGGGDITTPITPSNASPVSMTSGTGYKPTANGYAISSYDSVTPSSTPESVASGDIVKIGGSGVIVDSIPTPTSITPSNSTPAALTANNPVTPTANGYAISSYDSVTPSSTPESVSSGDIVKIGGSGVIVDAIPTPTSITPSNASPVALTADTPVNPTASGYAIASYDNLYPSNEYVPGIINGRIYKINSGGFAINHYTIETPSNVTPPIVDAGDIIKIGGNEYESGYLIKDYTTVTPSTSGAAFNSGFAKMSSSGYAYSQQPKRVQTGSFTTDASSAVTISLDFTPSLVIVYSNIDTTTLAFIAISENKGAFSGWNMNSTAAAHNIGTFTWSGNSFTHKAASSAMGNKTAYYVAIE